MEKIAVLIDRLERIGISVSFSCNYPWVYIDTINGRRVQETYLANHGYTIAFLCPDGEVRYTDIGLMFKLIRKYSTLNQRKKTQITHKKQTNY